MAFAPFRVCGRRRPFEETETARRFNKEDREILTGSRAAIQSLNEGSRVRHSLCTPQKSSHPRKPHKAGRATATKAKDGNYTQFWRIAAFSEPVQVELMRLTAWDAVAVEGALKAELYHMKGETDLRCYCRARPAAAPAGQEAKEGRKEGRPSRYSPVDATKVPSMRVPF
jgi:hypothetical protein